MAKDRDIYFKCSGKDTLNTMIQPFNSETIIKQPSSNETTYGKVNSETIIANKTYGDYKNIKLDEYPVREVSGVIKTLASDHGYGDNILTITNSELDKIEINVFKNLSRQIQSEKSSMCSLEPNIKLFKTTVQEILNNFSTSMDDYQHYKERFHEILRKKQESSVAHMEEFIKDMIQHIISSESVLTNEESRKTTDTNLNGDILVDDGCSSIAYNTSLGKNTATQESLEVKALMQKESILRLFLVDDESRATSINRILASEIHLKEGNCSKDKQVASTEDFRKIFSKKLEVEKYMQEDVARSSERDIPVKGSCPKKDIPNNEDFTTDNVDVKVSLISKICNYICTKLRKN